MMVLADILTTEIVTFFLIFCRVGTALMIMPIFGERYVMGRARLWLALAVCVVLTAIIPSPEFNMDEPAMLAKVAGFEVVVGVFIGATVRLVLAVSHLAGGIIAMQSGLASAAFFDPAEGTQASGIGNFLTMIVLIMILVSDGHHMMLFGLSESYGAINFGEMPTGEISEMFSVMSALAFETAVRIAAPLLIVGVMINVVSGVMNKLMPTFQVMFVVMPLQIAVAFGVLMLSLFITAELAIDFFVDTIAWLSPV